MTPPSARWIRSEPLNPEPRGIELAARRRLQQDVRRAHERLKALAVVALVQIEHDRALAAVVLPEEQGALRALLILIEGPDAPGGVAAWRLYLDDVRAQAGQREPAVLRLLVGQLDHANTGKRAPRRSVGGHHRASSATCSAYAAL